MRLPPTSVIYRDRLLDAMAFLLVDLHRSGVFWGDCSLANTLFRRDGDRIQAYLVDAETSEIFPELSDGQRAYDLEILVENVAFGLADLAAMQGRPDLADDAIAAAERVRDRYDQVWTVIHDEPVLHADDRQAIRSRVRKLNELGYSVDLDVDPEAADGRVRLRMGVTTRRYHARELERRTRIRAMEGQARLLLNDLNEFEACTVWTDGRPAVPDDPAERWLREVYRPTLARIAAAVGPNRDLDPGVLRRPGGEVVPLRAGGPGRRDRRGDRRLPRPRRAGTGDRPDGPDGRPRSDRRRRARALVVPGRWPRGDRRRRGPPG